MSGYRIRYQVEVTSDYMCLVAEERERMCCTSEDALRALDCATAMISEARQVIHTDVAKKKREALEGIRCVVTGANARAMDTAGDVLDEVAGRG